jgi:hypothetical protein
LPEVTTRKGLKYLDAAGPVRSDVTFSGIDGFRTTVVALIHPSHRHANLRYRRYKGTQGAEAELRMLRDGMHYAGVAAA